MPPELTRVSSEQLADVCRRLSMPNALSRIEEQCGHDPLCAELAAFCRGTRRGITGYAGSEDYDEQA